MSSFRLLLSMGVLTTLTGCMGSGHADVWVDAQRAYFYATVDQQAANVPASGTARYEGIAEVSAVDPNRNTKDLYVGLATYNAAFSSTGGRISGEVSDFLLLENLGVYEDPVDSNVSCGGYCVDTDAARARITAALRPAKAVSGQITLAETSVQNGVFFANASGSVEHGAGGETSFDGVLQGNILGNSGEVVAVNDTHGRTLDPTIGSPFGATRTGETLIGWFESIAVAR